MPARLGRDPREGPRQRLRANLAQGEQLLQVGEREHGIEFTGQPHGAHSDIDHRQSLPVQTTQESSLRSVGIGDRGQVGHQFRVVNRNGSHHHRVGRADQGPPVGILPEPLILGRHQLVAQDAARDQAETGFVAGVNQLVGRRGMEMGRRLGRQDEGPGPRLGDRQGVVDGPGTGRSIGQVGTCREALAATNAVLLDDLDHPRLRR